MSAANAQVLDALMQGVRSVLEAKDAEIDQLRRDRSQLWSRVSDLTDERTELLRANAALSKKHIEEAHVGEDFVN